MTLNGVMALFCVISPNSVDLGINYVKVVEGRPKLYATKMYCNASTVCSKKVTPK